MFGSTNETFFERLKLRPVDLSIRNDVSLVPKSDDVYGRRDAVAKVKNKKSKSKAKKKESGITIISLRLILLALRYIACNVVLNNLHLEQSDRRFYLSEIIILKLSTRRQPSYLIRIILIIMKD